MDKIYLIDFDSTFVTTEGLEVLAELSLRNSPNKEILLSKIKELTRKGMEGEMPFDKSLTQRIMLINCTKADVIKTGKVLIQKISPSILRNKKFFLNNKNNIYIISGGFKEFIEPVIDKFGIPKNHVFANTFIYDQQHNVIGVDVKNPMSQPQGKVNVVKSLQLQNDLYIIGDGYTDYEIKELGLAKKFIAFTENIARETVVRNADEVAPTFDDFLFVNKLPRAFSYPKNRINVLLLEKIHTDTISYFEKEGYTVEYCERSLPERELIKKISKVSILGIRSKTKITPTIIENAPHLLTIGVFAIGTNIIDLEAATKKGISVFNAPYSNTRSVAELIIGEIIMLARKTFEKSTLLHKGVWDKSAVNCHEIRGKKLGIIGYGHIGSQVSIMAESLGMDVYYYNTSEQLAFGNAKKCETMKELCSIADVVTVHVSGKKANTHLIDDKVFSQMKDGVLFLNASRGFVVDLSALQKYIRNGKIHGCAIDVFPNEPDKNTDRFSTPISNLPNVIITPHMGSGTMEAQKNIAHYVSDKIITFINSGNTDMSVNIPNLNLPPQGKTHRFLHIHKNVPGILSQINGILAENNSNVVGQYLKTHNDIGYVITDVDEQYNPKVIKALRNISDTIKLRILY